MDLRERLIDFCDWLFKENEDWDIGDWEIDDYLKSIDCALDENQAVRQNEDAENVCVHLITSRRKDNDGNYYCANCGEYMT